MAHIHEKIDFTVEVFIVYANKVLLRFHDKHSIWLSVGGHIELDEDPVKAALREVKEEVGLDVTIIDHSNTPKTDDGRYHYLIPPRYMGRHFVNDTHEHVVFVYFATATTDILADSVLLHEKGVPMKWVSKDELGTMDLVPNVLFYATEALQELGAKTSLRN